jgi:hypothetical protein
LVTDSQTGAVPISGSRTSSVTALPVATTRFSMLSMSSMKAGSVPTAFSARPSCCASVTPYQAWYCRLMTT